MNEKSLIEKIINSIFYSKSMSKASKLSNNTAGILNVLKKALNKIQEQGKGPIIDQIRNKLLIFGGLIKSYATGEYRDIELKNLVIILGSMIYFISPIDFIPDILPMVGFADDIALLTFAYNSVASEIEKYELWLLNKNLNS
ncbi:YkvA family protein [Lacihabitans lacunae]|uniref:YkvA family protein n=1 Tax=Lacihabitans lacunae TaxID=1028214 RepID=A0ABV7YVD5_9BACT